jgi:hypothetical protein
MNWEDMDGCGYELMWKMGYRHMFLLFGSSSLSHSDWLGVLAGCLLPFWSSTQKKC